MVQMTLLQNQYMTFFSTGPPLAERKRERKKERKKKEEKKESEKD